MRKYVDYIVVGGGISGCVLSYQLLAHGADVVMFDLPEKNKSSRVAAGLWNPLVLKRMKKVWRADEMIDELYGVYPAMEAWSGQSFFTPLPLRRLFSSAGEQNAWMELSEHPGFCTYLQPQIHEVPSPLKGSHGSALTNKTGRVDVPAMLDAVQQKLASDGMFRKETFDWDSVVDTVEGVSYRDHIIAHRIISCEGIDASLTPHSLGIDGFSPAKGEVLRVKFDQNLRRECVHSKHFILDEGDGTATVGATYAWDGFLSGATEEKRNELERHIQSTVDGNYTLIDQLTGVRPATKDRRPLVGPHPHKAKTYVFNGMGSRAILMAPLLAKELAHHLLYGVALSSEIDPRRFVKE